MQNRLAFAKDMKKKYTSDMWKNKVAFFLDGVSFYHKTNPADEAHTPRGHIWRKACKGLKHACTAKGSKVRSGGGGKYLSQWLQSATTGESLGATDMTL